MREEQGGFGADEGVQGGGGSGHFFPTCVMPCPHVFPSPCAQALRGLASKHLALFPSWYIPVHTCVPPPPLPCVQAFPGLQCPGDVLQAPGPLPQLVHSRHRVRKRDVRGKVCR